MPRSRAHPWTVHILDSVLSDGRWHTAAEIEGIAVSMIPDSFGYRAWKKRRLEPGRSKDAIDLDPDIISYRGKLMMAGIMVRHLKRAPNIKWRTYGQTTVFRRTDATKESMD